MLEIVINHSEANQKVFKFVKKYLNNAPLSLIYKIFRKKDVKVNGKRVNEDYILKENDYVQIYVPNDFTNISETKELKETKITFEVLYEDENLLAVYKPQGLLVVEDENESTNTLSNQVLVYLANKNEYDVKTKGFTPAPVHRIDRNTSGIVLIAKNMLASQELTKMFKERTNIVKSYLALVKGILKGKGEINKNLIKDDNKSFVRVCKSNEGMTALTLYEVKEHIQNYSLVSLTLKTGRTHQIRVHMSSIDHPLIGDAKYGDFELNKLFKKNYHWEKQFLHASEVSFEGINGPLSYLNSVKITSPLPHENIKLLNKLRSEEKCK